MKSTFLLAISLSLPIFSNAQHNHSHEQKPSNAREVWGDFEKDELIKTKLVDWTQTPIAGHVLKNGTPKKGFEFVDSIDIYSVVYDSDGFMVTGFMAVPKRQSKYPCVIFNRGGNRDFGQLLVGTALTHFGRIAAEGYVVIGSNYRGNSNSEGKEEFGGSDVNDVLNLVPALGQIEMADTSRIGLLGISRGGMMNYLAMKESCQFKAAIVVGALSDLNVMKEKRPDMESHVFAELIPNYNDSTEFALNARSANEWVNELCVDTKLLMLHGDKDDRCHPDMARDLHQKLSKINFPHTYISYKKGNHGLSSYQDEMYESIHMWLDKYVKNDQDFDEVPHLVVK
ncbi:prolyl oligopeptidase family serine peptidase [Paracrocinitomix mangrovi]|uniref:alpha/beta hydrolase family protein n=1 Tax=Paracrocinitomix mangrovi TaxID=2862509 RepID=UPI001C8EEAAB|nr:prolyl oligopeptidase family serine peptidase [Paracrocinitomix mangrovi]UKN01774.1 prolyl oligopeptidase family serine peptidase [Paracrocinitomix mangrovi]